jgi:predicted nucleic acid-binding Zn ribbon protein
VCPSCGKSSFKKQVTAAGFQLKGTGWYVTDFRGGSAPATGTAPAADSVSSTAASTPAAPASAPASAPSAKPASDA